MTHRYRRGIFWGLLFLALLAGIVYAFWPQPVPADLGEAFIGPLQVTVDEEGETRVKDVYLVSAPVGGRLLRIEGEAGDPVVAGETVLALIEPADPAFLDVRSLSEREALVKAAEAARALARAEVERARAEVDFAVSDLARTKRLYERGNVAKRTLESAELEVRTRTAALTSAEAALRVKDFELENARAALITPRSPHDAGGAGDGEQGADDGLCCVEVRAPVGGRILKVIQESESVIASGAPLLEIGDPEALEIVVDLLSADAVKVEEGAAVLIEGWGGQVLNGRVRRVEPYGFTKVSALGIEEQRVNVIIDFEDPPERWRRLGHGYRVEIRIVVWQGDDVLVIPISALFREGDAWATFVVEDGLVEKRPLVVGHRNNLAAEVLDGLSPGERVVLHPSDRIADGTRIVDRREAAP